MPPYFPKEKEPYLEPDVQIVTVKPAIDLRFTGCKKAPIDIAEKKNWTRAAGPGAVRIEKAFLAFRISE